MNTVLYPRIDGRKFLTDEIAVELGFIPLEYPVEEPPVGTNMKINIGDTFKNVDSIKINIGDSWKDVISIKQNIGDTWKTVF